MDAIGSRPASQGARATDAVDLRLCATLGERALRIPDARAFAGASPFPHVVVDGFFTPAFAERLASEFPPFERGNAVGDDGALGGKSVFEPIARLGGAYTELDALIGSPAWLGLLGRITGIPNLLYDPFYLGGGTHENRSGQALDPHIDFNYHPSERWHRRLNLIIYLNCEWDAAWGGSLELYADPARDAAPAVSVAPTFNRCVIFETSERSWHGFSRLALPPARPELARRSIALYFYTAQRPAPETAEKHSTVYVKRPLPARFAEGMTLAAADVEELRAMLADRDEHIRRQYAELARLLQAQEKGLAGQLLYIAKRAFVRFRR